jgi:N-acetylglutamate synthase-like GNAT family acetyltransferase
LLIRKARSSDQTTIKHIVLSAMLAPYDLDWRRFMVAEEEGQIVGVGQVRRHRDGSHELSSIAVIPQRQGQGIGSALIYELLKGEDDTVYLFCRTGLRGYYERFGFQQIPPEVLPQTMRRLFRFFRWLNSIASVFLKGKKEFICMQRTNPNQ